MLSSEERSLQEVCSQYNVDKTACKSYVQHLEFFEEEEKGTLFRESKKKSKRARDAVEDEKSPNSCEDDTNSDDSESNDSDYSSSDSSRYVEESFEVMFVPEEELQQVN